MNAEIIIFYILVFYSLFVSFFYLMLFLEFLGKKNIKNKRFGEITVIIPTYNNERIIEETIMSVFNQKYPKDKIKLIVVNDGSTDKTLEILKRISKETGKIQIYSIKNSGKSAAVNFALKKTNAEFVAVLDADTVLAKDTLLRSMQDFTNDKIMAVTCMMIPLQKKGFLVKMQRTEYLFTSIFRKVLGEIDAFPVAPGYALFRNKFFKEHGYFDEDNLTEDFEIALRIHKYHYTVKYNIDTYVKTEVPEKLKPLVRQRERWGYGTLFNIWKYRELFSKKYGDLALFLLPTTFFGIVVLLLLLFLTIKNLLISLLSIIHAYFIAGYYNTHLTSSMLILSLSNPQLIMGLFGFLLSLVIYFIIKKEVKEKISFFDYLIFLFGYMWILAFCYVLVIYRLIRGKKFW